MADIRLIAEVQIGLSPSTSTSVLSILSSPVCVTGRVA